MLQIKDICKQYKTGTLIQKALDHVSLNLRDNEFVAILGPSGSGKTTLLNVIGGLDRYDSGDLIINGVSTRKYKDRDWDSYRNHTIGFVFQSYNLIPHQTVLANVELALTISGISGSERRRRAEEALQKVGLGDQMHKKPSQMSGGQMQRVAIARALVNDPDIVLADEPTGALDSDTSIQVMNLLKEVAKDRLVVMVTHNPELAEQYATRIVRVKDGHVIDDTDPFTVDENTQSVHRNLGRASMSFLTALALSFNNLRTKKARTFLVAFAGSIGIIGIALIMSLSNGMNQYIADIEEETLSEYPLEIDSTSMDLTSMMGMDTIVEDLKDTTKIHEIETVTGMLSNVTTNDLKSLKTFLESGESDIDQYTNAIEYEYSVSPQIYRLDGTDSYRQVNPDTTLSSMGYSSSSSSLFSSYMSSDTFHVMPENEDLYINSYDVKAGRWPENSHEVVVVLTERGNLSDLVLYTLGVKDNSELDAMLKAYAKGETVTTDNEAGTYDPEDLIGITFKLVNAADYYVYDSQYKIYTDKTEDHDYMMNLIENGETLTVVGVVQQSDGSEAGMLTTGIGYSPDLIKEITAYADNSAIVKAQKADTSVNVLTGKEFGSEEESSLDLSSMFSIDENMMAEAFNVDSSALTNAFSGMSLNIDTSSLNLGDLIDPSAFSGTGLSSLDLSSLLNNVTIKVNQENLKKLFSDVLEGYTAYAAQDPSTDYAKLGNGILEYLQSEDGKQMLTEQIQKIIEARADSLITTEDLQNVITTVVTDYNSWAEEQGYTDPENFSTYFAAYMQTDRAKALLSSSLQTIQEKLASITLTSDEISAAASAAANGYTAYAQTHSLPDVTKIGESFSSYITSDAGSKLLSEDIEKAVNVDEIEQQLTTALAQAMSSYTQTMTDQISSAMTKAMTQLMSQITSSLSGSMSSAMSSLANVISIDTDKFANAIHMNMDEDELSELMMSMMGQTSSATYDSTIRSLGSADLDDPSTIMIYPKDFESKDQIKNILDQYNEDMTAAGKDAQVITYTDMVGTLMSSVTDIVNSISYILIAFVAISLIVSSIMIGVITYISVLERRKEIGILRAIGASKHNISQVFNAETFIIGLLAGLIGIGISLLLLIPANIIIHNVTNGTTMNAYLPITSAIGLIILSIILTLIGGLLPAHKAAKSDPVAALRTE